MSKININNMCASSDTIDCWGKIDFDLAEKSVKKLQKRIATAYLNDDNRQVMNLQNKLIHSFYAKALSIDIVTSNRGKHTTGIDNTLWTTPTDKFKAIDNLKRRGYRHRPLKRIYIPKYNGHLRPLGISTMNDRAMQTLYRFALEPIAEITADTNSFGFRQNRSARDAIVKTVEILSKCPEYEWVLKADIKSCFDNISHEWLMDNIPMDKEILKQFLKCGYVYDSVFYPTDKGIPQGSCISGVLCNMTLDGLEKILKSRFGGSLEVVRYADDFIIIGTRKAVSLQVVVPVVECFLFERGLSLSEEKTKISHIEKGFTFLGYRIYKEHNDIISVPTRENIDSLIEKIEGVFKAMPQISAEYLYKLLKMKIEGWLNYYKGIAEMQSLHGAEYEIVSYTFQRTGNKQIAKFIGKLFAQYDL